MAGNIVKWWKHKILGGYKQFSVQECTTDSEELMYHQVRASSSCSAPPDLLLVSDRENNIPLRSPVVNIITTPPGNATNTTTTTSLGSSSIGGAERKHAAGQQHQQQQHNSTGHGSKELNSGAAVGISKHLRISSNRNSSKYAQQQQQQQQVEEDLVDAPSQQQQQQQQQGQHSQRQHHSSKEERIRLEEFTCDVSVEGGKSSQPLQFSFTFYDLDGHHGKITKDDIVGIVYTIYESIGKSVVVPHCGSKTINVRLTVSPEGKSKAHATSAAAACNKLKKLTGTNGGGGILEHAMSKAATTSGAHASRQRQHRYRPRKLIKSDDEDDDSNSEKEKDIVVGGGGVGNEAVACGSKGNKSHVGSSSSSKYNKMKMEQTQCCQSHSHSHPQTQPDMSTTSVVGNGSGGVGVSHCQLENPYENMMNLKCCSKTVGEAEECRGVVNYAQRPTTNDIYMKQASNRVKMLRRARKQKYQDHCNETRQRSLSVGNESCWKNRHLQAQQQQQQQQQHHLSKWPQQQQESANVEDVVDGVELRKPNASAKLLAQKRNSAECWKTALNRNDLISIIRESMEKNRLCFQLNGKPQANVSPIRQSQSQQHHQQQQQQQHQRQRSNTVSKIPTLIANHNNIVTPTNNCSTTTTTTTILQANLNPNNNNNYSHIELNIQDQHNNSNSSSSNNSLQHHHHQPQQQQQQQQQSPPPQQQQQHHHSHPQPHIPIYHQQLAINPAVLAAQNSASAHNKMNLCGYDSFLHATICGGGTSHSPPPPPSATTTTVAAAQLLNNGPASNITTTPAHAQSPAMSPSHYSTQPIATVQPIITVPKQQHHQKSHKSGTKLQHNAAHNTPTSQGQSGGNQRLSASQQAASMHQAATRHNLAALNSKNPSLEKSQVEQLEKWLHAGRDKNCQKTSKEVKNYGNLIYAKLSEQLQAKERRMRHKQQQQQQQQEQPQQQQHRHQHQQQYQKHQQQQKQQLNTFSSTSSSSNGGVVGHGSTKLHYIGNAIECENLLGGQTTTDDEETNINISLSNSNKKATNQTTDETKVQTKTEVVTDTLIDFRDDDEAVEDDEVAANKPNVVTLPAAAVVACSAHIDEKNVALALEVDDDEEEEEDEVLVDVDESALAGDNNSAAMAANTSTSSSLIHRYVHEHIHHHYHHFKEKNEA